MLEMAKALTGKGYDEIVRAMCVLDKARQGHKWFSTVSGRGVF
jgi:hypothetical protein